MNTKYEPAIVLVVALAVLASCDKPKPDAKVSAEAVETTGSQAETKPQAPEIDYSKRPVDQNCKAGMEALQKENYDEAEKILLTALNQIDQYKGEDAREASILNNLASVYEHKEMYMQAVPLLNKAQKLFIRAYGRHYSAVYVTLGNLGRVLGKQHRWEEAANVYQTICNLMEEDRKSTTPETYKESLKICSETWLKAGNAYKAHREESKLKEENKLQEDKPKEAGK